MKKLIIAAGALAMLFCAANAREVINLDGTWEIAEGAMDKMPEQFPSKIPVPGLVDMAVPAFEKVGAFVPQETRAQYQKPAGPRREAYWYRRTFTTDGEIPAAAYALRVKWAAGICRLT